MASKCCGFSALRCWLVILNVFYIAVSLFLIGLVIAARTYTYHVTGITVVVGIAVAAALLFTVAVIGLIGTLKHNQVALFFYMVILGLTGIILFSVSVAALALPKSFVERVFETAWSSLSIERQRNLQESLNCCGFNHDHVMHIDFWDNRTCALSHPSCNTTKLRKGCCDYYEKPTPIIVVNSTDACSLIAYTEECPDCNACYPLWEKTIARGVLAAGAFGLIFSFTQVIGIVLTFYYRNLKDPSANPSAFL